MNENQPSTSPLVGVVMGSKSDWDTMRNVQVVLEQFDVPHECRIVSAHRTPLWLAEYAAEAEGRDSKSLSRVPAVRPTCPA